MRLTPDGVRYLALARGERQPVPFHLRWLLARLLGTNAWAWIAVAWGSALVATACVAGLATLHGATRTQALVAAALFAGLPSVRFATAQAPVLVDMPAMAAALLAALLGTIDMRLGLAAALLAGCISERAPIWAALYAWSPWLLIGLVAPILRRLLVAPGRVHPDDPLAGTLEHPIATGWSSNVAQGAWRDPSMLWPWGACLAALLAPSVWLMAALGAGYAQLGLATDRVRLYQQAAPVVCVVAALAIPEPWVPLALAMHWWGFGNDRGV